MPDGPGCAASSLARQPREKNAKEVALRGARLRLARETDCLQPMRHAGGSTGGGSRTTRQYNSLLGAASWQGQCRLGTGPRSASPDRVSAYISPRP